MLKSIAHPIQTYKEHNADCEAQHTSTTSQQQDITPETAEETSATSTMAFSFANKVVLITGGTKGIGRAAAIKFAAGGAKVAVNYSSDSKSAEDTLSEIGKDNGIAIKGDAGSVEDCKKMVDETVKAFGKIDVLVPNAGLLLMADLEQTKEEDYDRLMRVNVKGPYFLAQVSL